MKTMAIRLTDETSARLNLIATLDGTTVIEQVRVAVENHLDQKMKTGDLAERARAVLDDIDRDAQERKTAIETLFQKTAETPAKVAAVRKKGAETEQ